jgi:hypothetical protein
MVKLNDAEMWKTSFIGRKMSNVTLQTERCWYVEGFDAAPLSAQKPAQGNISPVLSFNYVINYLYIYISEGWARIRLDLALRPPRPIVLLLTAWEHTWSSVTTWTFVLSYPHKTPWRPVGVFPVRQEHHRHTKCKAIIVTGRGGP